jgi:guanine deaminase
MELILTNIINPVHDKKCHFQMDYAIVIKNSKILDIGPSFKLIKKYKDQKIKLIDRSDYFCLPSFFDMHFHWVQDDVRLMPKDSLLEWLSKYTWPYEAKFKNKNYSKKKALQFSNELMKCGTLGGACYASMHPHTVVDAQKYFKGDFIVGNVLMDMNSPKYLTQSASNAIHSVEKLAKKFGKKYAVTPRFAPTTSPHVMKVTSQIGKKNKSFIQTHLSETPSEIEYVLSIYKNFKEFKKIKSYTEIYKKCNVLGPKTIMGHGIYLSKDELKILSKTKTAICHCPTSNAEVKSLGLGSGLFDFKKTEKEKVNWALGSDIGGGPYLSMFDVIHSFVSQNNKVKRLEATYIKGLYRATLAGAKILELNNECGSLEINKWANMIFIKKGKTDYKSAEFALKNILSNTAKKRSYFDSLVQETVYHGITIYTSIVK